MQWLPLRLHARCIPSTVARGMVSYVNQAMWAKNNCSFISIVSGGTLAQHTSIFSDLCTEGFPHRHGGCLTRPLLQTCGCNCAPIVPAQRRLGRHWEKGKTKAGVEYPWQPPSPGENVFSKRFFNLRCSGSGRLQGVWGEAFHLYGCFFFCFFFGFPFSPVRH